MKDFVKRMIDEHKQLVSRIEKLSAFISSEKSNEVHKYEFANLCMQLKYMQGYCEVLEIRLENQGIIIDGEDYFEHIPENSHAENLNNKEK